MTSLDKKIDIAINSLVLKKIQEAAGPTPPPPPGPPPSPTEVSWFFLDGSDKKGPINQEEIVNLLSKGEIDSDTLVWKKGMSDWTPVKRTSLIPKKQKILDVTDIFSAKGAKGSGRYSDAIANNTARAMADPKGLMKALGITGATGSNDLEACASVINQAMSNKVFSKAFGSPVIEKKTISFVKKSGTDNKIVEMPLPVVRVPIKKGAVSYRNAVFFVQSVLIGAYNAGYLKNKIESPIQFINEDDGTKQPTFYSTSRKVSGDLANYMTLQTGRSEYDVSG